MTTSHWSYYAILWLKTAWHRRYLICLIMLVMPVLGFTASVLRPKMYEATMTILIQESARHNPFLEDLAVETRVADRITALDALLHSRHILTAVAMDLELINDDTPPIERERRVQELSSALTVRLIGDELLELKLRQRSSEGIDEILIAVAQRFMDRVLAPEQSSIAGSQAFLEEQIAVSREDLATAEAELAIYLSENAENLPDLHNGNVRRLADLRFALSEKSSALDGARARYGALIERLAENNPAIASLDQQISEAQSRLSALRSRYTDGHSAVITEQRQVERLMAERDAVHEAMPTLTETEIEDIWTAAARAAEPGSSLQQLLVAQVERLQLAREELIDLERQVNTLNREVIELDNLVLEYGEIGTRLRHLESEVEIKREIHESLRERAEMARVTGALGRFEAPERVKVIDLPEQPTRPVGLPAVAFVILGVMAGIGCSIGIVAVCEILEDRVRTIRDVQQIVDPQLMVRIPHLASVMPGKADLEYLQT